MKQWRLQHGETYLVTGEPVIVSDDLTSSIIALDRAAAGRGAAGDGARAEPDLHADARACCRWRWRCSPAALTFGALALVGRVADDGLGRGAAGAGRSVGGLRDPVPVARRGGSCRRRCPTRLAADAPRPRVVTAHRRSPRPCSRASAAMLVLLLSPVPMVRGFGLLLVVGRRDRVPVRADGGLGRARARPLRRERAGRRPAAQPVRAAERCARCARAAWRPPGGARASCCTDNPLNRFVSSIGARSWPCATRDACSGSGLALAALGWGLDTQTQVQTDIAKLVPQNLASLQNLDALERVTGVGGEIDLMVSAHGRLTKPATIEWMSAYESAMLKRFGYSANAGLWAGASCARRSRCPTCFHDSGRLRQRKLDAHDTPRSNAACSRRSRRTSPRT